MRFELEFDIDISFQILFSGIMQVLGLVFVRRFSLFFLVCVLAGVYRCFLGSKRGSADVK